MIKKILTLKDYEELLHSGQIVLFLDEEVTVTSITKNRTIQPNNIEVTLSNRVVLTILREIV